jgi:hypothetical protein
MNLLTRLEDWPYIILPITIILSFLLLGWLVEQRVVSQLLSIAREKNLRFSEGVLRSLRGLSILWFGLLGLNIALPHFPEQTISASGFFSFGHLGCCSIIRGNITSLYHGR